MHYLSGAFASRRRTRGIDPLLKDRGGFEHDDAAGRDWYFLASSGIAAHALAFLAHDKHANDDSFTFSPRSRQSEISLSTCSTSAAHSVRDRPPIF
jgi:hypothetical protein